jgi:hypothetical protein
VFQIVVEEGLPFQGIEGSEKEKRQIGLHHKNPPDFKFMQSSKRIRGKSH